ncbi:hypothetical protein [Granulosicoccus antarcticus]|uniref:Uncharacterized protein n=1 Tax=Granulosicoccus antarcticus IMCC3135 TaxID=1192854 RepID=A0A2Z2NJ40_9GAMM|nr:hypothetical protein [Granulosicoccus antarcticus]ASJ70515.1 hypothetical protein IMCC3135_02005 [Granulosicoccus antarcticus IMCC3135]
MPDFEQQFDTGTEVEPFVLKKNPDWHAAAQDLISGLCSLDDKEERIELLESVCVKLGDRLYPAFLQILHVIDEYADDEARSIMASTLVNCLQTGRLPSGKLAAWGSSSYTGDSAFGQSRRLGPIEFVCAWYAQPSTETPMSQQQFSIILNSLLSLVSSNSNAKQLYCQKLISDAEDPMGGSLSKQTRAGLIDMTQIWQIAAPEDLHTPVVEAFLHALQSESLLNQISNRPF